MGSAAGSSLLPVPRAHFVRVHHFLFTVISKHLLPPVGSCSACTYQITFVFCLWKTRRWQTCCLQELMPLTGKCHAARRAAHCCTWGGRDGPFPPICSVFCFSEVLKSLRKHLARNETEVWLSNVCLWACGYPRACSTLGYRFVQVP